MDYAQGERKILNLTALLANPGRLWDAKRVYLIRLAFPQNLHVFLRQTRRGDYLGNV